MLCWGQGRRRVNRRVAAVEIWAWVHRPGSLAISVLTKEVGAESSRERGPTGQDKPVFCRAREVRLPPSG